MSTTLTQADTLDEFVDSLIAKNRSKRGWLATMAHGEARTSILCALPLNSETKPRFDAAMRRYNAGVAIGGRR